MQFLQQVGSLNLLRSLYFSKHPDRKYKFRVFGKVIFMIRVEFVGFYSTRFIWNLIFAKQEMTLVS